MCVHRFLYAMKLKLKIFLLVLLVAITPLTLLAEDGVAVVPVQAEASLEDQLNALEQEIANLQAEQDAIQSDINSNNYLIAGFDAQASALYGEIEIFQKDIQKLELEIQEIELSIQVLNKQIEESRQEIEESEAVISELENESSKRIKDSYMKFRVYGDEGGSGANLFNVDSINDYFKNVQYKDLIQNDTNYMMNELARLRQELVVTKAELEESLVQVEKDKTLVEIQRVDLDKRKSELEVKVAQYNQQILALQQQVDSSQQTLAVFEQEQIQLEADAELIRQELFNSFSPTAPGEFVKAGRIIGQQGCTGLCSGAHLHFSVQDNGGWRDPCGYLPGGGPVSGCGWGNRLSTWPIAGTVYYTSAFGNRCFWWGGTYYCDYHTGADFAGVPWNTAIYAAHDGYAYKGTDPYGANYVIICENTNCNVGIKTGYWHLSSF